MKAVPQFRLMTSDGEQIIPTETPEASERKVTFTIPGDNPFQKQDSVKVEVSGDGYNARKIPGTVDSEHTNHVDDTRISVSLDESLSPWVLDFLR